MSKKHERNDAVNKACDLKRKLAMEQLDIGLAQAIVGDYAKAMYAFDMAKLYCEEAYEIMRKELQ